MSKRTGDPITLGSGKLYCTEYVNAVPDFAGIKALCIPENRLALIKSGASLEYTQETYTEKDDLGIVAKTITTSEEVKLKGGLLTWTGNTLSVLIDRSNVQEIHETKSVKTRVAAEGVQLLRVDPTAYPMEVDQYAGCWATVNGQRFFIGANTTDTFTCYVDETKTRPMSITCDEGATITIEVAGGYRATKIGGAGNAKGKYYVLVFHHEDKQDGDLWLVIVGRNTAGLSITFKNDEGSLVEPEFTAKPHDEEGTLVVLYEQLG